MAKNKKSMIGFDPLAWLEEEPSGSEAAPAENSQSGDKQDSVVETQADGKKLATRKSASKKTAGRKNAATVKQIELLGKQLDEVALLKGYQMATDKLDSIVEDFYGQLFSQYPEVKPLFARSDLATQGKKLQAAVQLLVDHLHQPEKLQQALQDLGRRHQAYGALPEHYPLVVELLLASFKQHLGRRWTRAINTAWQTLLDVASAEMCAAYDEVYESETQIAVADTAPSEQQTTVQSDENQTMHAESLLELQAIQDISQSAALKTEMLSLLENQQTIQIDASRVERIDGTALQLLCALFVQAENNGVSLQWLEPSDAFLQAAKYSGLTSVLNLQS
jgi:hemoglobin-like flavoprotein/anti-anti-sigma regulatory factor